MMMRIGGACVVMVRICTGEVWVRSTLRSPFSSGREEEGVVHLARRMAVGEIQRREIEIVGLDVGAFGDREAHVGEDRRDLVDHLADRMDAAACLPALPCTGSVTSMRSRGEARIERQRLPARLRGAAIAPATASRRPLISGPAFLALLRRHRAERLQKLRDEPFLPSAATRTASSAASSAAARPGRAGHVRVG